MISDLELAILNEFAYTDGVTHKAGTVTRHGICVNYDTANYYEPVREVEVIGFDMPSGEFILSVRGTEATTNISRWYTNWYDIVRDIRCVPWRTEFGWGHAGFYKGAKHWLDEHFSNLPLNRTFCLTGHSMGAQVAAWLAFMLRPRVGRVVLFAEPRGFFRSSERTYRSLEMDKITTSYINNDDWIRRIPPWGMTCVTPKKLGTGSHDILDYINNLR